MRIAIDCDLRTSYLATSDGWSGRHADPASLLDAAIASARLEKATILFEIASPVSFNRGAESNAAMTQLAKWAIWNVAWATRLDEVCRRRGDDFLVAPSNVWTKGHPEKVRHMIANCTLRKKDLRECEAMLFFHNLHPEDWVPLPDYLRSL